MTTAGVFTIATVIGIEALIPPLDYLPKDNRNLVFSVMVPPPGYNVDQPHRCRVGFIQDPDRNVIEFKGPLAGNNVVNGKATWSES